MQGEVATFDWFVDAADFSTWTSAHVRLLRDPGYQELVKRASAIFDDRGMRDRLHWLQDL